MRDPKRIEECLYYIDKHWQQYPDVRFNQLMFNLWTQFSGEHGQKYSIQAWSQDSECVMIKNEFVDLFNVEDDKWIEWLKGKVNS